MSKKPNIRFKEFSDDWEQRKFGDLGSVAMCKRIFKEQTSANGDIPFYKIGTFGTEPDAFISRELFEGYKEKFQYPNIGDMLISASGTIGRTVEYKGEEAYFQDSNIVWFKHDDRVDNSFLKYIYEIVKWSGIEGSTIKRLYNDNFLKTEFTMPKLAEQQRVGTYFSTLDHLITLHQRKCDKLKELKKHMLKKMFPKNNEKFPEYRFDGFTDPWEQRKVLSCIQKITDFRGRTPKKLGMDWSERGYLALSALNVKDGYIDFSQDVHYGDQALYDKWMSGNELHRGQVLFTTEAPMGNVAQVPDNRQYILSQRTIAFDVREDIITENFLATLLRSPAVFNTLSSLSSGGTAKGVSQKSLAGVEVRIPVDLREQALLATYFHNLDHLITLHQRKVDNLKIFKKFMLKKMFV